MVFPSVFVNRNTWNIISCGKWQPEPHQWWFPWSWRSWQRASLLNHCSLETLTFDILWPEAFRLPWWTLLFLWPCPHIRPCQSGFRPLRPHSLEGSLKIYLSLTTHIATNLSHPSFRGFFSILQLLSISELWQQSLFLYFFLFCKQKKHKHRNS